MSGEEMTYRSLAALPRGEGAVYLSWRMLASDSSDAAFTLQRRHPGGGAWQTVSAQPVTGSTDCTDRPDQPGVYEYRVADGQVVSETVEVDSSRPASNLAIEFPLVEPASDREGNAIGRLVVGDLENNGRIGFVTKGNEDGEVVFRAYSQDGRALWAHHTRLPARGGWDGRWEHVPCAVWDINGDGRTEFLVHDGDGREYPENFYDKAGPGETLTALDTATGKVLWRAPWPATRPRVMFTVGHLRGLDQPASVVVQDGTYGRSPLVLSAIDGRDGTVQWQVRQDRPGGHNLDIADVDADGLQQVICGGVCYRGDGSVLWTAEWFGHTDISKPARYLPDRPGLQTFYAVESDGAGVYLVDSAGETIWKKSFGHAHIGWVGRYADCGGELMIHAAEKGERDRADDAFPIIHPDGHVWRYFSRRQAHKFTPAGGWATDGTMSFIHRNEKRLVRFLRTDQEEPLPGGDLPVGATYGRNTATVDIVGDFRENVAGLDLQRGTLFVAMNPQPADRRMLSPNESFEYRHDRSQLGSGYYTYICPPRLAGKAPS